MKTYTPKEIEASPEYPAKAPAGHAYFIFNEKGNVMFAVADKHAATAYATRSSRLERRIAMLSCSAYPKCQVATTETLPNEMAWTRKLGLGAPNSRSGRGTKTNVVTCSIVGGGRPTVH